MARKANVKKAQSKKKSKQKKPPKKQRLRQADTVYVVSSIELRDGMETAFRKGLERLSSMDVNFDNEDLGYDLVTLKAAITAINSEPRAALIATVGGLVTFQAADAVATKPFISLVGSRENSSNSKFRGGVTLQSFRMNTLRLEYIKEKKGFAYEKVGLLYNPKSAMKDKELARWKGGKTVAGAGGSNNSSTYPSDFAEFPKTGADAIDAIVISADPFFLKSRDKLVDAANRDGRFIVYPLQNYRRARPEPTPDNHARYGPTLQAPYRLLGQCAGVVLKHIDEPLDPLFSVVEDDIEPPL